MTDKEKIRSEIKRRRDDILSKVHHYPLHRIELLDELLSFINSLPEEKPNVWDRVDINKAIKARVKKTGEIIEGFYDGKGHFDHFIDHDVFDRYSIDDVEIPYDEAYLNECIAKASKTWKGVDVDKYMDEVRGRESDDLEKAVDAEIVKDIHNLLHVHSGPLPMPTKVKFGDKVRIIILPEEEQ